MTEQKIPPHYNLTAFNCPFCDVFAHQEWYGAEYVHEPQGVSNTPERRTYKNLRFSTCQHCDCSGIWFEERLISPPFSVAPLPTKDMPEDIAEVFKEARDVLEKSPRASAALLRLVVQKLCIHLGSNEKESLAEGIRKLKEMGLPKKIEDALYVVRVVGNNAVHPGMLDLNDKREIALELFRIVNLIVEVMITIPKKVAEIGEILPPPPAPKGTSKGKGSGKTPS